MTRWQARAPSVVRSTLYVALPIFLIVLLVSCYIPQVQSFWQKLLYAAELKPFSEMISAEGVLIHMIDVGKADAILVECDDTAILIDSGTQSSADTVLRYLKGRNINKLDALVLSHGDSDHTGGADQIMRSIPTEEILCSAFSSVSDAFQNAVSLHTGDEIAYGALRLEILAPGTALENENDNSLVFRLYYGSFSMLFCGDIEREAENRLLESGAELRAHVLKVAHHGSDSSTSQAFLEAVSPKYALISVEEDRSDLPRNSVLKRLHDSDIPYYRTDKHGSIVLSSNGEDIYIRTER